MSVRLSNGISIDSAVFAWLTNVINRQTDKQTTLLRLSTYRQHLRMQCGLKSSLMLHKKRYEPTCITHMNTAA